MVGIRWTQEEVSLLHQEFPRLTPSEAEGKFHRRYATICAKALREGIKLSRPKYEGRRNTRTYTRVGNLTKLLDGTMEAFYWLGFYLADGSISTGDRKFVMSASEKDVEHLRRFARFVDLPQEPRKCTRTSSSPTYPNRVPLYSVQLNDVETCRELRGLLGVGIQKTYEPPINLHALPEAAYKALLIGFIDGDGSICKSSRSESISLAIELHGSWMPILCEITERAELWGFCLPQPRTYKKGYAKFSACNLPFLKMLHLFALEHGLPILDRKWDKVPTANPRKYTFRAETTAR